MELADLTNLQAKLVTEIMLFVSARGFRGGHHFTEQALAREFNVSRSPIRSALMYLASTGFLEARPNQGFFLTEKGERAEAYGIAVPVSGEDALYLEIASDRVTNELPQQVTESDLSRRYGASRGVLNRVMIRLSQDGIVKRGSGKGWVFLETLDSVQSRKDSYRFRLAIEPISLTEVNFKADVRRMSACRSRQEELLQGARKKSASSKNMFEANAEFHEMLAEFSGNQFFLEAVQRQNHLRRLIEYRGFTDPVRIVASCQEHLAILDAVEAGDNQWASVLMRRHLDVASKVTRKRPHDP